MMTIYLIRHSITEGNRWKRYIGRTDEPLCRQGVKLLEGRTYPQVDKVYASPMKRCLQTAGIIYPDMRPMVIEELAECDFGLFENKNYQETRITSSGLTATGRCLFRKGRARKHSRRGV